MTQLPPAGWYPESGSPTGQRYWDGSQWTEHTAPQSAPAAPPVPAPQGWQTAAMLTVPTVQIEQRGRVVESASLYALADPNGAPLGQAAQVGQGRGGRLLKAMTDMDRNLAVTIQFEDPTGAPVMTLSKPGGIGPQRFVLTEPAGATIAEIVQKVRMVREAFDIVVAGHPAGSLSSESWRDRRFSVLSVTGQPYALVHKLYEGYARAAFTSADKYVVEVVAGATPTQRAIALGAAIAMDISLYQS